MSTEREERTEGTVTFDKCDPANIGRCVRFAAHDWRIVGINYLGDYDVERFEVRDGERIKIGSSCVLGLPANHGHYAVLLGDQP